MSLVSSLLSIENFYSLFKKRKEYRNLIYNRHALVGFYIWWEQLVLNGAKH